MNYFTYSIYYMKVINKLFFHLTCTQIYQQDFGPKSRPSKHGQGGPEVKGGELREEPEAARQRDGALLPQLVAATSAHSNQ